MATKTVQRSVVVVLIALVLLSVAVAQGYDDAGPSSSQKLIVLFETALVDDSANLWKLQQIYFNPQHSRQSPGKVCLSVFVTVTIANPDYCFDAAFVNNQLQGKLQFNSYYELHQQAVDDDSDTSELATLMTKSGITGMFYTMDQTFYSIMKSLSRSIALSIPYIQYIYLNDDTDDDYHDNEFDCANIRITIAELDEMPCWDEAVYALRSVLMWVSFIELSTKIM
jgi:hypothetical protein